jgi:hypothetical protein
MRFLHIDICIYLDNLITLIKENKIDEKIINELQQLLRTSRWNKSKPTVCYFSLLKRIDL